MRMMILRPLLAILCVGGFFMLVFSAVPVEDKPGTVGEPESGAARVSDQPLKSAAADGAAEKSETKGSLPAIVAAHPFRVEIETFRLLNKKIFLTDEEREKRLELLEHREFIHSLTDLLKVNASHDFDLKQTQNAALDFLFASLRNDARSPAADVLMQIVEDAEIERQDLDRGTRQELAGVKAEVLFYWSALDPSSTGRIERSLPGPVSRRIWQNVIDSQKINLDESTEEAKRYPASNENI